MKHGWKRSLLLLAVILAALGTAFTVYGATTIGNLSITLKDNLEEGIMAEPEVSVSPSSCEVSDVRWSKPVEDWKPGKVVFGYLTITANEGREFERDYKSSKCSVRGADFRSASSDEDDPATLLVTVRYTPKVQLGTTESAGWTDGKKIRASWKKVPYATMYEVRLYQNDTWIKTLEVTGTSVDISSYIKSEGDYFYEVRAKAKDSEDRKYLLTGEYVASEDTLTLDSSELGDVGGTWQNYQEGRKYRTSDGNYPSSQWLLIMGKWYYFNEQGYASTGWFKDQEKEVWYYMDDQGQAATGWKQVDGVWYYFNSDGEMQTGWIEPTPGAWYYANPDGSLAVNTVIDGQYTVGDDGRYVVQP